MQFLITTNSKHVVPPEMVPMMIDGLVAWAEEYEDKMESIWSTAGTPGGGAIVNVESLEELDELMIGFPFGPFSDINITPIVELGHSMERVKSHFEKVAALMNQ